jgi:hypothetical protein
MARRRREDVFPGPLAEFREQDWPPVEGECLRHYACRGQGYEAECVPRPGEYCGQLCYEHLAAEYPDRPEMAERARRADAYTRWRRARLSWLGESHPEYLREWVAGLDDGHAIRYGWRTSGEPDGW